MHDAAPVSIDQEGTRSVKLCCDQSRECRSLLVGLLSLYARLHLLASRLSHCTVLYVARKEVVERIA